MSNKGLDATQQIAAILDGLPKDQMVTAMATAVVAMLRLEEIPVETFIQILRAGSKAPGGKAQS